MAGQEVHLAVLWVVSHVFRRGAFGSLLLLTPGAE
jgi:hypothetical protein